MTQSTAFSILKTGANVFLTGEPGSGKTFLVNMYVRYLRDHDIRVAITASTGIAATHIGGSTIHSWSGIGIRKSLTKQDLEIIVNTDRLVKQIQNTHVLIIDEMSMLDAATLDMVEQVCRAIRKTPQPFGGLQVVLVGDFFQLPPVSKHGEEPAQFAFTAAAWAESLFDVCYLTEQHRQSDAKLSSVLAAIRGGVIEDDTLAHLNTRRVEHHDDHHHATKLYSHNANVDEVNADKLADLPGELHVFDMEHHGQKAKIEALTRGCLSPEHLELKVGATVMCTRNNPDKGFVNGTLATVVDFDDADGYPIIQTKSNRRITVEPMEWAMEDGEKVSARIIQVPLRLAWAMTVHKSQGMSLDAAVMDLSHSFAFGQGYVALSRVRTLDGLHLLGWNERALRVDPLIQAQDRLMRVASEAVEVAWSARTEEQHQKAQQDFIRACAGRMHAVEKTFVAGVATEVPMHPKRLAEIRKHFSKAYTPWSADDDARLAALHEAKVTLKEMSQQLQRHAGGIRSRLRKLELEK